MIKVLFICHLINPLFLIESFDFTLIYFSLRKYKDIHPIFIRPKGILSFLLLP